MSIEAKDVCFRYGHHVVLNEVSFCLQRGELLFILGQNGAGKSSLLKCLLGLSRGYEGSILLDGQEVRSLHPGQLARKAAYIPQNHQPGFDYTVLQVALMGFASSISTFSVPKGAQRTKAEQVLNSLNIAHLKDRGYMHLSGGERQLAIIARALIQEAPMLLMDEPVAGLDFGNQQRVLSTARALSMRGYGIALTSHHPEHAFFYADRVMVLDEGHVAAIGPPREVLTKELLERIYRIPIRLIDCALGEETVRMCCPATK